MILFLEIQARKDPEGGRTTNTVAVFFPKEILPTGEMAGKIDEATIPASKKDKCSRSLLGDLYFALGKCSKGASDFPIVYFL